MTDAINEQERIARELLTQRPLFVGTSGGVAVYWDGVAREFAVVNADGSSEIVPLADTPFARPVDYCEHIAETRGWDSGPNIGGSLLDDLHAVVEAVR